MIGMRTLIRMMNILVKRACRQAGDERPVFPVGRRLKLGKDGHVNGALWPDVRPKG